MNIKFLFVVVIIILLVTFGCDKPEENQAPILSFLLPTDSSSFVQGEIIKFYVEAEDPEGDLFEVRFYVNNLRLESDQSWPYEYFWDTGSIEIGDYVIKAEAIDPAGASCEATIVVYILQTAPIAFFTVDPLIGTTLSVFNFDASDCSDLEDDSSLLQVRWNWENDNVWDTEFTITKTANHIFTTAGNFTISMEVMDTGGKTSTSSQIVEVLSVGDGTVTDIDGNVYNTINIGEQEWMTENLKVTHYLDNTPITYVADNTAWSELSTEAYSVYNNNSSSEADTYGALYNWYAVNGDVDGDGIKDKEIAPEGWRVPTDDDWKELETYLGMNQSEVDNEGFRGTNEGSKLAGNADLWLAGALESDSGFGTSGFTMLPGGARSFDSGDFDLLGSYAYFWSTTERYSNSAWHRGLHYYHSGLTRNSSSRIGGFSVRCVKD